MKSPDYFEYVRDRATEKTTLTFDTCVWYAVFLGVLGSRSEDWKTPHSPHNRGSAINVYIKIFEDHQP